MNYVSGAIFWVIAWAIVIPEASLGRVLSAAFCSWVGLAMWELAMVDYRKGKS